MCVCVCLCMCVSVRACGCAGVAICIYCLNCTGARLYTCTVESRFEVRHRKVLDQAKAADACPHLASWPWRTGYSTHPRLWRRMPRWDGWGGGCLPKSPRHRRRFRHSCRKRTAADREICSRNVHAFTSKHHSTPCSHNTQRRA